MTAKSTNSKRVNKYFDKNPVEAVLRDTIDGTLSAAQKAIIQEGQETASTLWRQLLGENAANKPDKEGQMSGDLTEGEELDLTRKQQKLAEKLSNIEAGYDYKNEILHFEKKEAQETQTQTSSRVQEILVEIKNLSKSVKELEIEVKDVSMDSVPAKAGKYHQTFFEYLLTVLRNARLRVENSANWLHALTGKKAKKGYWDLAKKHGTSYSLSADRVVSQQVG